MTALVVFKTDCSHWREIPGQTAHGKCALGKFGGNPSHGNCHNQCKPPDRDSKDPVKYEADYAEYLKKITQVGHASARSIVGNWRRLEKQASDFLAAQNVAPPFAPSALAVLSDWIARQDAIRATRALASKGIYPPTDPVKMEAWNPVAVYKNWYEENFRLQGRLAWAWLHSQKWQSFTEAEITATLKEFEAMIPAYSCGGKCKAEWIQLTKMMGPPVTQPQAMFAWTVAAHNFINKKLKKPMFTIEDAIARWSPPGADYSWGPEKWAELHRWALAVELTTDQDKARAESWLLAFIQSLPCGTCRMNFSDIVLGRRTDFASNDSLFVSTVLWHNCVSLLTGGEQVSADAARKTWATVENRCQPNSSSGT
jgi:Erv1 / Alr family